jgi:hypothetical protein
MLRLAYMTSDCTLGQSDAHSAIMPALLGHSDLRRAVAALITALGTPPLPTIPQLTHAPAITTSRLLEILSKPPKPPSSPVTGPEIPGSSGHTGSVPPRAQIGERMPRSFSSVGTSLANFATEFSAQFAATSMADRVFGAATLLLLRRELRFECALSAWKELFARRALHYLPDIHCGVGCTADYLGDAAREVEVCVNVDLRAGERGASEGGIVARGALEEGHWDAGFLKKEVAAHGGAAGGTVGAAGCLWGSWLLVMLCQARTVSLEGDTEDRGRVEPLVTSVATGVAGMLAAETVRKARWSLKQVGAMIGSDFAALQAAGQLFCAALKEIEQLLCCGKDEVERLVRKSLTEVRVRRCCGDGLIHALEEQFANCMSEDTK